MSDRQAARMLGEALADLIRLVFGGFALLMAWDRSSSQRRASERAARDAERRAEAQMKEWRELVERQTAGRKAGNATQERAREALGGRGGLPNPLDEGGY
jgi:hypothetical protein